MEVMETEGPMTEWNDDRLNELNERVKDGFASADKRFEQVDKHFEKVDERFVRLEGEMKEGFAKAASREEAAEIKGEMRHLNQRFDRLYYTILVTVIGLAGSLLANNVWG